VKTRTIRLISTQDGDLPAIVRIEAGRKVALYAVREVPSQFGGRGFLVREVKDHAETYSVHCGTPRLCDCFGHLRHGRCKHVSGLQALIDTGRI